MEGKNLFEKIEKIKMPIRILILVGALALLVGIYAYFIHFPKKKEINKTTKEIATLKNKLNKAKIRSKDLKKLNAQKARVNAKFREALKLLPNTKEIPNLLRKVTELGNDSRLDFRVFKPKKERPKKFYVEMPFSIEVRGNYHNVAVFFDKVGHMERIMNIHKVSMKPIKGRSTTLITTCEAVTYRFKGKPSAKKPKKKKKKKR